MRISDWSSDVCSSDLPLPLSRLEIRWKRPRRGFPGRNRDLCGKYLPENLSHARISWLDLWLFWRWRATKDVGIPRTGRRSEEHTSELQSLMRNSYAVFCLKKKKPTIHTNTIMT